MRPVCGHFVPLDLCQFLLSEGQFSQSMLLYVFVFIVCLCMYLLDKLAYNPQLHILSVIIKIDVGCYIPHAIPLLCWRGRVHLIESSLEWGFTRPKILTTNSDSSLNSNPTSHTNPIQIIFYLCLTKSQPYLKPVAYFWSSRCYLLYTYSTKPSIYWNFGLVGITPSWDIMLSKSPLVPIVIVRELIKHNQKTSFCAAF